MNVRKLVSMAVRCPVCGAGAYVGEDGKSVFCNGVKRHCFDFSADGYLSIPGQGGGDSREAVRARTAFLSRGYYSGALQAICDTFEKYVPSDALAVDAGCGEGYYTSKLSRLVGGMLGADLSKFACSYGARCAKREKAENLLYAVSSVFSLPIKDGAANAVVNIFAPCAENEYCRVLRDGGYLFVVGAGKEHLMGLKRAIYDSTYENGERSDLPRSMQHVEKVTFFDTVSVNGRDDVEALFSMTPYYWRTGEVDKRKLCELDKLTTEVEFEINVYKKAEKR